MQNIQPPTRASKVIDRLRARVVSSSSSSSPPTPIQKCSNYLCENCPTSLKRLIKMANSLCTEYETTNILPQNINYIIDRTLELRSRIYTDNNMELLQKIEDIINRMYKLYTNEHHSRIMASINFFTTTSENPDFKKSVTLTQIIKHVYTIIRMNLNERWDWNLHQSAVQMLELNPDISYKFIVKICTIVSYYLENNNIDEIRQIQDNIQKFHMEQFQSFKYFQLFAMDYNISKQLLTLVDMFYNNMHSYYYITDKMAHIYYIKARLYEHIKDFANRDKYIDLGVKYNHMRSMLARGHLDINNKKNVKNGIRVFRKLKCMHTDDINELIRLECDAYLYNPDEERYKQYIKVINDKLQAIKDINSRLVCSCCKTYSNTTCLCNTIIYCSIDCQKKDWPLHKDICIATRREQRVNNIRVIYKQRVNNIRATRSATYKQHIEDVD